MTSIYEGPNVAATYNLAEKLSSRHINSITANNNRNLFVFSTNSLKKPNEIHLIEYDEDTNKISNCGIYQHPGVVHKVFPSPVNGSHFFSSYSEYNGSLETNKIALCNIGKELQKEKSEGIEKKPESTKIDHLFDLKIGSSKVHSVVFPNKENKILIGDNKKLTYYDLNELKEISSIYPSGDNTEFFQCEADPHHQNLIATISNTDITFNDLREKKTRFTIDNAHRLGVLDMDFNPNKQYYLMSSGEDCLVKFWEFRKPSLPVKALEDFQNWVLNCKFNKYHDQLILTSCDDGTVNLHRMASISSAPVLSKAGENARLSKEEDGLVKCYDEHEDSVYSVAWSTASAWVFASISYQANVVINLVPVAEKYRILL